MCSHPGTSHRSPFRRCHSLPLTLIFLPWMGRSQSSHTTGRKRTRLGGTRQNCQNGISSLFTLIVRPPLFDSLSDVLHAAFGVNQLVLSCFPCADFQMGVGGVHSWGARPSKRYLRPPHEPYRFVFVLQPLDGSESPSQAFEQALDEMTRQSSPNSCPLPVLVHSSSTLVSLLFWSVGLVLIICLCRVGQLLVLACVRRWIKKRVGEPNYTCGVEIQSEPDQGEDCQQRFTS